MLPTSSTMPYFPISYQKHTHENRDTMVFFKQEIESDYKATIKSITKGDIHGNILVAIQFLIDSGAILICAKDFDEIKSIFAQSEKIIISVNGTAKSVFSKENFLTIEKIISRINILNKETTFRLLGDILNDRRGNSYFNLSFFFFLSEQHGFNIERIWSNHDLDFFINFNPKDPFTTNVSILATDRNIHEFALDVNDPDREIFKQKINEMVLSYSKNLNLISYSILNNTIYTHAPVNKKSLIFLLTHLKEFMVFEIKDMDLYNIENGIISEERFDCIIKSLNNFIQNIKINHVTLMENENISNVFGIIYAFVWFRNQEKHDIKINQKMTLHVHGHDGCCTNEQEVLQFRKVSLDTLYGKFRNETDDFLFNSIYQSQIFELNGSTLKSSAESFREVGPDIDEEFDEIFGNCEEVEDFTDTNVLP